MEMCDNSGFSAEGIAVGSLCKPYPSYQLTQGTGKNDFGRRKISGPLLNRWHPNRRLAWIARMHELTTWYDANRIDGCTMISLTGYQEKSGLSFYDTWDAISDSRIKMLKILRKVIPKLNYFWVVEPHTEAGTGYPHFHLVVFAEIDNYIRDNSEHVGWAKCPTRKDEAIWELMDGEGMEDKLRRLYSEEWKTGSHTYGLDFKVMKGDDSIKNLKNYLMKYIAKGYIGNTEWSQAELLFNAHIYGATHGNRPPKEGEMPDFKGRYTKKYRCIGMSRFLSNLLKPEQEDKEDIIWLHTDETEPTEVRDPFTKELLETYETRKPLYDRLLIPNWLCPNIADFTWGRPIHPKEGDYSPLPLPELTLRQRLKLAQDGYL